jgi:aminopeptidase N
MRHIRIAGVLALASGIAGYVAPLAGDTYPRQSTVDAQHYVFRLTLSDTSPEIVGEATVTVRLTADNVREVSLDLTSAHDGRAMTVTGASRDGAAVTFAHANNRLTLPIAASSRSGQLVSFTIQYHGIPASPAGTPLGPNGRDGGPGLRIIPNKYGEWSAFSENWPNRARQWLPMIDHPYDKATSEFIITAPSKYQVVANGLLQESIDLGDGRRLTHWKQSVPIASWLNAVGVEQFAVHHAASVKGIELTTWVAHQDDQAGRVYFEGPAREALEFYGDHIGPYPYEKLANVAAAGLGGGTEHASSIFYGETGIRPDAAGVVRPATGLVYHEIAHQWFGDSVTEKDWDDVWLSEGFATYFTLLCTEHWTGRDAFVAGLQSSRQRIFTLEHQNPGMKVTHDNLADMGRVLNNIIYQKGGWTLHMLRNLVGTDTFWTAIRTYYARYRDASASTADLQRVFEETSGQPLGWFFDQWLRRAGSPMIAGSWRYDAAAKQIEVTLDQTQPGTPYRLPLDIGITVEGAAVRTEHVEFTQAHQSWRFAAGAAPSAIMLDPATRLLFEAGPFTGARN